MRALLLPCLLVLGCKNTFVSVPGEVDADGDGYRTSEDCDDGDAAVHPGAPEACNGADDDCDGLVDEDWPDVNGDGTVECELSCPLWVDAAYGGGGLGSAEEPFDTIGEALEFLPDDCEQVLVGPGTYEELVDFGGRDLQLVSTDGPELTVIDGGGAGAVVTIAAGETDQALLQGFTLRGGAGWPGDGGWFDAELSHGGGLYVWEADPTILDNVIEGNTTTGRAAGALLFRYDGWFEGNVVRNNTITVQSSYGGAGAYVYDSDAVLWGNSFTGNLHLGKSGVGGGMLARYGAPWIVANLFEGNGAESSGGGIRTADSAAVVAANLVLDNDPDGIVTSYEDCGVIVNNTVVGHPKDGIKSHCSEEYCEGEAGPTTRIVNNISVANGRYGVYAYGVHSITVIQHNLCWGNERAEYAGLEDPTGSDGNISQDPLLDDEARPSAASPAVDAGLDASAYGVTQDIEGAQRPQGTAWDIGAYEI